MSSKYLVEQVDIGAHADAITALWARCLLALSPQAAVGRLQHRYLHNPAGTGATLLLQQSGSTEVAGVQCLHARTFHLDGRTWRVAGMADYAVAESHRSLGPALQLMKRGLALGRSRFDWVYGLTNDKSEAVCKRSGLQRFGSVVRWSRPLRSKQVLRRWLPGWAVALAAPLLDGALLLRDTLRVGAARRLQWQDGVQFGPALDAVWQRRTPELLLSERSRALLEWRFAAEMPGRWTVSLAHAADGVPLGYVVWRLQDGVALVGDFFCADPARDTGLLLRGWAWHLRAQPIERLSLEFLGAPAVAAGLQAADFRARPGDRPLYLAAGVRPVPPLERWYFTSFDRDGD